MMNRRNALGRLLLVGGGTVAAYSGYEWYHIGRSPDLSYLDQHSDLIADLAETIIPTTNTPGAKQAKVEEFITAMIKDCNKPVSQNKFIDGLKELEAYSLSRYKNTFSFCTANQKMAVLRYFEAKEKPFTGLFGKINNKVFGKSFFAMLKEYTVEGFCTSEPGATIALAYLPIPGKYIGCLAMQAGQKTWATN